MGDGEKETKENTGKEKKTKGNLIFLRIVPQLCQRSFYP